MRSTSTPRALLTALLALSAAGSSAFAANYYWGQTGFSSGSIYNGNFTTAGNWFTDSAGTAVATAAPDSLNHDLFFNTTPANAVGGDITVNADFSARSLTFNTSGVTRLVQSGSPIMSLGEGGITLGTNSGAVTLGTGNFLNTRVVASQAWTNNSSSILTVRSLATSSTSGNVTLTLSATGSGGILFSQNIGETASNALAIVVESSGAGLVNMTGTNNVYSGGTIVKRGSLSTNSNLGSGAVLLGDTTGSGNASLQVRNATASAFTNNITVQAGSTGTKTLTTNQTGGVVLDGTLTLNDNLTIVTATDGTFNGVISGTGDIVKGGASANLLTFAGDNTFSGDLTLNIGAFTLAEAGSLTFYIGANGVTNQVNGSTTGAVAFNGTFTINFDNAALANGNSWTLVSLASIAETYGPNFALTGFNDNDADNIWTNLSGFSFNEATGILTYSAIPEPSTFALLGGLATLLFASARRRHTRA